MIVLAAEILQIAEEILTRGFIIFIRVGAVMALLPAFGERAVPMRIRLALALAFTVVLLPLLPHIAFPSTLDFGTTVRFLLTETLAGLVIGIGVRLFILALQTAGSIAAQSTSLAQIFGGTAAEPLPAIGHLLVTGGLALAVISGLHIRAVQLLVISYDMLPPGTFPDSGVLAEWGTGQISRAFSLAFTLAAPFVIVSILYNLTLGVINRAMPQLMVAFVGAPVITAGGLLLLFLLAPLLLSAWVNALNGFLADPTQVQP